MDRKYVRNKKEGKWNKKKYDFVIKELNMINKISLEYNLCLQTIIKNNQGDYRRYFLNEHHNNLRKSFIRFIDYSEQILMEIDREYIRSLNTNEVYSLYLSIINNSYKLLTI